jgi:hypothetical protein
MAGLWLLAAELLAQDRVDHGVPPRPRVYRCPLMVPSSTIPAARMVRADAWVL